MDYCSDCHGDSGQTPYIASSNIDTAYEQSKSRINLSTPANSRFVERLRFDFHNCWTADCESSAAEMETAILDLALLQTLQPVDPNLVTSKALVLDGDGLLANSGGALKTTSSPSTSSRPVKARLRSIPAVSPLL